ncbi:MAG: ABC transporter permease [Phycisphaerales bacterium]
MRTWLSPILALARKDILLLLRDRSGLFFTFVFPILIGVFFGTIFAGGGDEGPRRIKTVVVDEDNSAGSADFVKRMNDGGDFETRPAATRDEGVKRVRSGEVAAVVVIPKGFGASASNIFAGNRAALEVGSDPSRAAEAGMIRGLLTELAFSRFGDAFNDPTRMRGMAKDARAQVKLLDLVTPNQRDELDSFYKSLDDTLGAAEKLTDDNAEPAQTPRGAGAAAGGVGFGPVAIKSIDIQPRERFGPKNAYAVTFAQAIMWGVVGCCSGFAVSLLAERSSGTLVRLRMSPLGWPRVLAGKALACLLTTLAVGALMVLFAVLVFRVRPVSWAMLGLGMACVALCFVGIMMLLAVVGRKTGSGQVGWSVMLVLTMVGGGSIPLFVMPQWLQTASGVSPVKWGILALEGGLWRGTSMAEMMLPCAVLLGIGAIGFVAGSMMIARDDAA